MEWEFDITLKNRKILASFLNSLTLDELNKSPEGFSNNIIWNIGHIIATQQLLVYNLSGLSMHVSENFIKKYGKGSKPNTHISKEEMDEIKTLLFSTLEQTQQDYKNGIFKDFKAYTTSTKSTIKYVQEAIQFNNYHEGIHLGYILAMKKSL